MSRNRHHRFTIFDQMEAAGIFDLNPNNPSSRNDQGEALYKGPTQYPKMFYHPKGELRVVEPEHLEPTPTGPVLVAAKYELINVLANGPQDEERLRADGWHDHPSDAARAAGRAAPPRSAAEEIESLRRQLAEAQAAASVATPVAPPQPLQPMDTPLAKRLAPQPGA